MDLNASILMGKIGFWKKNCIIIIFVPSCLEKELIVIYFHNHCAKYSKYEEVLSSASDLQQICSRWPHLPENWWLFPWQCGLDGVLPPILALTLRHTCHRPCSLWCCQSATGGEGLVLLGFIKQEQKDEPCPEVQAEKGKTYKSKAPETA